MPEVIVVASIGNRDITYEDSNGKVWNPGFSPHATELAKQLELDEGNDANLRAISAELLRRYRAGGIEADSFEFPILRPGLEKVLTQVETIDKLLMIVTDQPAEVRFRTGDTIHCGELLAALVLDAFPGRVIEVLPQFLVVDRDPQKPNVMYPLIRDELSKLLQTHDDAEFHALATGGTPAITDGLRHAAMNVFREDSAGGGRRCSVVQVDPPTSPATAGTARVVDWEPYLEDVVRDGARELVKKGNFAGALEVLEAFPRGHWPAAVIHLLKHADARVSLRVGKAGKEAKAAQNTITATGALDAALRGVNVTGRPISEIAKVNEVRFLIEFALEQQRYADALVRIEQFRESARSVFSLGVLDDNGFRFLDHVNGSLPAAVVNGCALTTGGMELRRWLETNDAKFDRGEQHWVMRNDKDKQSLYHFGCGSPA